MEARFTDDEKGLLEHAFQLRESQTEEQRAIMRAEFEANWPALVAYIKQSEARGEENEGRCAVRVRRGTRRSVY